MTHHAQALSAEDYTERQQWSLREKKAREVGRGRKRGAEARVETATQGPSRQSRVRKRARGGERARAVEDKADEAGEDGDDDDVAFYLMS